jgi:Tol biopolymer transport system component
MSHRREKSFFCAREDHSGQAEAINTVVCVNLKGGDTGKILVSGNDFYSSPRLNPDGSRLSWLTWNHPNMPWDGTELWVGKLTGDGSINEAARVAGGVSESIFQPEWSPDGTLYFVSDRTGWWNIYGGEIEVEPSNGMPSSAPSVGFCLALYGFASERRIVCSYTKNDDYLCHAGHLTRALD